VAVSMCVECFNVLNGKEYLYTPAEKMLLFWLHGELERRSENNREEVRRAIAETTASARGRAIQRREEISRRLKIMYPEI